VVTIKYTATGAMANADSNFMKANSRFSWYFKMTDTQGSQQTLLYGYIKIAKGSPQ
jgi:hypothetical protein